MSFCNPEYLWLLLLLVPMLCWYVYSQREADADLQVSSLDSLKGRLTASWKAHLRHVLFALRMLAVACVVVAISRPQLSNSYHSETTEGIDIVMALDISGTMLSRDLRPDRLEAAKRVAIEFVSSRPNDNIGLVVFAGESFTQCPLTGDHAALVNLFQSVKYGMIEDGTAIGLGLANSVNRIKDSQAKSKVVILLTDGTNNAGDVDPITAAEIAQAMGVRVYTIGVGTRGVAPTPVYDNFGNIHYVDRPVDIDETTLRKIASLTGGSYFRATDANKLKAIYEEIDKMEKTKLHVNEYSKKDEKYLPWALAAILFLLAEILIRNTVLRRLPE